MKKTIVTIISVTILSLGLALFQSPSDEQAGKLADVPRPMGTMSFTTDM